MVGDWVDMESVGDDEFVIVNIYERKNTLVRPLLANLDQMLIVISQVPEPDFLLVDKLIIKCFYLGVRPVLIINKCDICDKNWVNNIVGEYLPVVDNILVVSSKTGENKEKIQELIKGKVSSFVGQSAVGKSCLLNMLGVKKKAKVGDVSIKTQRGKHTTRHSEISVLFEDAFLADTPGFSRLDLNEINYKELTRYYPDFEIYAKKCRYQPCSHIHEKETDCEVKKAINDCKINQNRYNRYIIIYNELKKYWEKMYV